MSSRTIHMCMILALSPMLIVIYRRWITALKAGCDWKTITSNRSTRGTFNTRQKSCAFQSRPDFLLLSFLNSTKGFWNHAKVVRTYVNFFVYFISCFNANWEMIFDVKNSVLRIHCQQESRDFEIHKLSITSHFSRF